MVTSPETQELEEEQQGVGVCCRLHRVSPPFPFEAPATRV